MPNLPQVIDLYICKKQHKLPVNQEFIRRFKLKQNPSSSSDYIITYVPTNNLSPEIEALRKKRIQTPEKEVFLLRLISSKVGRTDIAVCVNGTEQLKISCDFVAPQDLFHKTDLDKVTKELESIARFADSDTAPEILSEYAGNYCMQAAERGLSVLLDDKKAFYAVKVKSDADHKNNGVSLAGKNAEGRGDEFVKKTYAQTPIKFSNRNEFSLNLGTAFVDGTYDESTTIRFKSATAVHKKFLDSIQDNIGYHVYYCSLLGSFHTMILVIDYRDPCNATYELWDQHGRSNSTGQLEHIANGDKSNLNGISGQLQWLLRFYRRMKITSVGEKEALKFYPKLDCMFYKIKNKIKRD